jgi:hypothetical protein
MKNCWLTSIILCLLLSEFFVAGCSGVYVKTKGTERTVIGFSLLTDRHIDEIDVKTPEGGHFKLHGAGSEQSKAVEAFKSVIELLKFAIPLL